MTTLWTSLEKRIILIMWSAHTHEERSRQRRGFWCWDMLFQTFFTSALHWSWVTNALLRNAATSWVLLRHPDGPSEQLQAAGDVVHHLLLSHDSQDGARTRLNLQQTAGRLSHESNKSKMRAAAGCTPHLSEACILDQVSGQVQAHGQGLQL